MSWSSERSAELSREVAWKHGSVSVEMGVETRRTGPGDAGFLYRSKSQSACRSTGRELTPLPRLTTGPAWAVLRRSRIVVMRTVRSMLGE